MNFLTLSKMTKNDSLQVQQTIFEVVSPLIQQRALAFLFFSENKDSILILSVELYRVFQSFFIFKAMSVHSV